MPIRRTSNRSSYDSGFYNPEVYSDVGGGVAELWTPADITTSLWLDADDSSSVSQSGGAVSQWNDKSGNSRNFTATGATQPTYTTLALNNKAILEFAGDYLTSVSAASTWVFLSNTTASSIFIVLKAGTISDPNAVYGILGTSAASFSNPGMSLFWDDRVSLPRNNAIAALVTGNAGGLPSNAWNVNAVDQDSVVANTFSILGTIIKPAEIIFANRYSLRVNGGASLSNNLGEKSAIATNPTYTLQIGATGNNVVPFTGGIAELVIVSGAISDANRQRMEGYLAHKWGLTASLPFDHPYKNVPPTA